MFYDPTEYESSDSMEPILFEFYPDVHLSIPRAYLFRRQDFINETRVFSVPIKLGYPSMKPWNRLDSNMLVSNEIVTIDIVPGQHLIEDQRKFAGYRDFEKGTLRKYGLDVYGPNTKEQLPHSWGSHN